MLLFVHRTVKENLVRVDGSFSGYKMQDANEFLTRILDTVKDEIDRCHMTTPSPDRSLTSKEEEIDEIFPYSTRCQKLLNTVGKSSESELSLHTKDKSSKVNMNSDDEQIAQKGSEGEEPPVCDKVSSEAESESGCLHLCPAQSVTPNKGCDEEILPRNPIKDNFEFQLFESYRCLGSVSFALVYHQTLILFPMDLILKYKAVNIVIIILSSFLVYGKFLTVFDINSLVIRFLSIDIH